MLISQILRTKGDMVFTIAPAASLADACALLRERRVGALVVREGAGPVLGILSERDVVRAAAEGAAALHRPVRDCMTGEVVFADPSEAVDALLERMTDRRFRHLPVCQGDRLMGIVSIGDLVKAKIDATQAEADGLKAYIAAG
ncbi:MAG: CBS domain-containing protein [Caulobacteraceae bacterium]|nr:CBS domain-containing protein [Caulobacter sp.]